MIKEAYLTKENSFKKTSHWLQELSLYKKRWKFFTLENCALIVIDMQNYFLLEYSHAYVPSSKIILMNIKKLIRFMRENKKLIIFTYYAVKSNERNPLNNWWRDMVPNNTKMSHIFSELQPHKNDLIIRKPTYDLFYKSKIENYLYKKNIDNLIITGVLTNLCCETTARAAFVRNFNVFFVLDGTATYNEKMHCATLINLAYGFATPITINQIIGTRGGW